MAHMIIRELIKEPESKDWSEFAEGDLFRPAVHERVLYLRCDIGAIRLRDTDGNQQYEYKSIQDLDVPSDIQHCVLVTDISVTLQTIE